MYRTKEYRVKQRKKVIAHKKAIIRAYAKDNIPAVYDAKINTNDIQYVIRYGDCHGYWNYKYNGKLDKGKIHCSCEMCSFHDVTQQDRRQYEKMLYDLCENHIGYTEVSRLKKEFNGRYYPKHAGKASPKSALKADFTDYVWHMVVRAFHECSVLESDADRIAAVKTVLTDCTPGQAPGYSQCSCCYRRGSCNSHDVQK